MQSLICFFIFTGFGLGLYAQFSPSGLMLIVFGILVFQWIFSYLWLLKYQFGPMEKVWRNLSYKKMLQKMNRLRRC
ncbi:MAG: DUF418 domain-containing protein [Flavobacteriales bacterium]|nr:DUF418 domain-containing protein [Flavobacteriales bacterium]